MSDHDLQSEIYSDADESGGDTKYLMCRLGREAFGIDIRFVTDIIEMQPITALPDMPAYVRGVINLRGQVIPLIDLRLRFKMPEREYDDRTVITVVEIDQRSVGFIIDTATEVQDIREADISAPPEFSKDNEKNNFVSGLGKFEEQVVILLDMERLVVREEAVLMEAAG